MAVSAAKLPLLALPEIPYSPDCVQPVKSSVSKPPLVTSCGPSWLTLREMLKTPPLLPGPWSLLTLSSVY